MRLTVGILAHVDAGKTTFSERALYLSRAVRSLGRVDHQDTFLDTHPVEKVRGITIFSGQAAFPMGNKQLYWLDTPGHVDFSTEMERAVSVMDYAILVVSCAEGVQSHTETVWQLLQRYKVPTFVFLNKIDRAGADPQRVLHQLRSRLSADMLDLRDYQRTGDMDDALQEAVAEHDERLLEALFSTGYDEQLWREALVRMVRSRTVFPVMAGSALEGVGVAEFLRVFDSLTVSDYAAKAAQPLTARVYRVRHDTQGTRLCFMKLLTGSLRVKDELPGEVGKVNEIRIYHGDKFHAVDAAQAGDLIAIPGIAALRPGDSVGTEDKNVFLTEPMMAADVLWDEKAVPAFRMMQALRILEDEEPSLSVTDTQGHIAVHIMGGIQLEVLGQLLQDRFGYSVSFGPSRVLYRETIATPAIGIGHYEPLKHYAEVHLKLLPGKPGSGVTFRSTCHVDDLPLVWQKLICSHVFERTHKGVLTGAPLTDVEVVLQAGRAHLKHTEGGDFRQAVYRAIRNALMYAENVLLEPVCGFLLRAPGDCYGTLTGALSRMKATINAPEYDGEDVIVTGEAPWALFAPWQEDYMMLTHGRGTLRVWTARYAPCHNQQEIVEATGYNPLADDSPDSVFCQKGAGFNVPWNEVRAWAHVENPELNG